MSKSLSKSRFIELFGDEKEDHHLIDLCLSITDGSHNPPKGCDTSNNLMISSQNVINNTINLDKVRFISDEDYVKENKRTNIQEGDVLLTIVGTIGRTAVVPKLNVNLVAQRSICILHPNKDVVEPNFLSYMLDNVSNKIEYESRGIAQKGIYLKQLKEFNVIFPKIEQQREFTEFIHQIDKSKFILQKMIEKLELLKKSRFIELFGRLGKDEKGWGLAKLSSCCDVNPPKIGADLPDTYKVSFIPMASVSERGDIDTSDVIDLSEVRSGFSSFVENDVLFAKITPCMENGKGAVARRLFNKIGFGSTEFHVLRPKTNLCNPYWLYALTSLKEFRLIAEQRMTGSAGQKRVPAKFLSDFEISIPPIELQNKYVDFTKQLDKSKLILQKQLDDLVGETK